LVGKDRQHDAGDKEELEDGEEFVLLEEPMRFWISCFSCRRTVPRMASAMGIQTSPSRHRMPEEYCEQDGQFGSPAATSRRATSPSAYGAEAGDGEDGDGWSHHDAHLPQVGGGIAEQEGQGA
jgi:hypothetical protein